MVKYAPRKVYIRESGGYVELSYTEFCRCRESDQTYMDKLFIPIQGCLLEVVREQYTDFYRDKERWRYLQKLDTKNRLLSLDGFTDSEGNPLDFITDEACVLLTQKRNEKDYEFEIEVSLMIDSDRLFEDSRPTYTNIRKYVFDKYGVKLQLKDIADVKRDYGMKMKVNKHLIKGDEPVRRKCTPNKRKYIIEALKYYHAI